MCKFQFLDLIEKNIPAMTNIDNWSLDNKIKIPFYTYIGVQNRKCILIHPFTKKEIKISEESFQYLYDNWERYKTGFLTRNELRGKDRYTTYTICILKYLEDNNII